MLYFLGFILLIMGAIMLVPIPVAYYFNESSFIPYFVAPAVIAIIAGIILRKRFPRTEISLGSAMVVVALTWIIISLFSSIPFMLGTQKLRGGSNNPTPMGFVDSYFESMSGFTATGLTMIPTDNTSAFNVETCPSTILFWRSLTQWVGGLGVIVLFLAALIGAGKAARKLYVAEARVERTEPTVRETAKSMWKIYTLFTLVGILGFLIVGMPLFDSVNHSMTGIATGGFTVHNDSFAGYGLSAYVIAIPLMLAGATSFAIHQRVLKGKWRELFRSVEVKLMLVLVAIGAIILASQVSSSHAIFQSTSALTGTGFSTTTIAGWGDLSKGVLISQMMVGGCYASTSSAIKLIRTIVIIMAVYWVVKKSFLPDRAVVPMKISGRVYNEREIMEISIYAFIYVLVLIGGAMVLVSLGNSGMDSLFESASAQGNVGLSVGITSANLHLVGKVTLIIQMLVGRLEILPVVALASYIITRIKPRPRAF
jgi:trk system potassium uptake protein TrkH